VEGDPSVTFAGLALASSLSGRSEYELLAQAVDDVLSVWRDGNGGFYFDPADLTALPRRAICAVKGCGRPRHLVGLCLCSTCYARYRKGADLTARVRTELAQRGPRRRERSRETMRLVARPEQSEALSIIWESGGTVQASKWVYEDRQAEQLGDPGMWQAVADEALERAWYDLTSGAYEQRLVGRLAALRPPKPKVIQSPLVASVRSL
jgi:hypothetical protein